MLTVKLINKSLNKKYCNIYNLISRKTKSTHKHTWILCIKIVIDICKNIYNEIMVFENDYQNDMVRDCYITKIMIGWFVGSSDVLDGEREKKLKIKDKKQNYMYKHTRSKNRLNRLKKYYTQMSGKL